MLEFLKNEANLTTTENGAVTLYSSGSDCLDLFAAAGALRNAEETEIITRFLRAYAENPDTAMKLLFFARDIRGGLGERRTFRVILRRLAEIHSESVLRNLPYIAEYGRWDDVLTLLGTPCEKAAVELLKRQLDEDLKAEDDNISLLAKWLPSVNTSNKEAVHRGKLLAKRFGMTEKEYRKALSFLRGKIRIIENNLRERDYTFEYSRQPSRALFKYRAAFMRNDVDRYRQYLSDVKSGVETMHTDTLAPYDLVSPFLSWYNYGAGSRCFCRAMTESEADAINTTWNSLPDYGGDSNMLAVVDTSGSMYDYDSPMPAAVALSLGLYFAERNKGAFANRFIEFSANPRLIEIKGETFADRLRYAASFNEIANTDIEAVFRLVLNAAVKNNVTQSELPETLVIISDMEFDDCTENAGLTNFENAKKMFAAHGYTLPKVVFWNVASRTGHQPVTLNEQGVALVSGCTPKLFEMIAGGELSPLKLMNEILQSDRYKNIAA